jgi:hypothetical protein
VYEKEFKVGFKKNTEAAEHLLATTSIAAGLMLLFYGVECGLKHILCQRQRGSHLDGDDPLLMTHNLSALVKALRFSVDPLPPGFKVIRDIKEQPHPTDESHLAWRYGVSLVVSHQDEIKTGLLKLVDRIREDIP